ncbi:MAG: hypothetical protein ACERKD_17900 [Prolixibacteraceae bacterium]
MIKSRNDKKVPIKALLILMVVLLNVSQAKAQDENFTKKRNFKIAFVRYPLLGAGPNNDRWDSRSYQIEYGKSITNNIEISGYLGACLIYTKGLASIHNQPTIFYGLRGNVQLIPLFLDVEKSKVDFYVSSKLGGFTRLTPVGNYPEMSFEFDYGLYFGAAYYVAEKVGVFAEYGFGNYTNSRFGLTYRFNKVDHARKLEKK